MFLSCFTQIHGYLDLLSPKNCFLYFQKTNMTLNISSLWLHLCNVSPLWRTGYSSLLIKEFLSSTPSINIFFLQALKFINTFCTLLPGHQLVANYKRERPGQGLNHDPSQSNPDQILKNKTNQNNIISRGNDGVIIVKTTITQHTFLVGWIRLSSSRWRMALRITRPDP